MRNQDGFSGLFFAPLPNFEELIAVEAVIGAEKGDEISAIQPKCCRYFFIKTVLDCLCLNSWTNLRVINVLFFAGS